MRAVARLRRTDEALLGAREALARRYDALEKELAGREFLCGAFGVADIATFIMVYAAKAMAGATAT